jgi:hypothetical protein
MTSSNPFEGVLFPIVKKVAAKTIGLDLVSVQPMDSPFSVAEKLREEKLEKRKATIKKILSSDKKNI